MCRSATFAHVSMLSVFLCPHDFMVSQTLKGKEWETEREREREREREKMIIYHVREDM